MAEPAPVGVPTQEEVAELKADLERTVRQVELLRDMQARSGELVERVHFVTRLSRELNSLSLADIERTCIEKISMLLGARVASLYLYHYQHDELELLRSSHPHEIEGKIPILSAAYQNRLMARALREKRILLVRDFEAWQKAEGVLVDRPFQASYQTGSCVCIPLIAGNRIVGVLNFADKLDGSAFDEMNDLPVIEQLSYVIGIAIRNCQLYGEVQRQARMDAMTELLNHSAFFDEVERETLRVNRYGGSLSLLYFDVDNFKKINDTMGHLTGDHVVKEVARLLRGSVRNVDVPARYGGDEFVCVLPNTPLKGALVLAHRLHQQIVGHPFDCNGHQFQITSSMGVAEHVQGMTANDLIAAADAALYRAKQNGKNQVRHSAEVAAGTP